MARRDTLGLSAVRTEGAILPPSILQRVHREDPSLGGMKPEEFGLSGERIREAASRAWNALQAPWRSFQAERAKLSPNEAGTGMTRSRWLLQILKALDYGAIDPLKESLTVGDREYPVSHLYGHVPMHLVGCNLDLDKKTPGAVGAARMTPHGMVQLLLNGADSHLWGFVSNGLRWRILRDSMSLSRQAMVEFDLEAIFEGQLYDEFLLFYLLCHQTRVKSERPEECWLEKWSQTASSEGKRALDTLRNGVENAIVALGQGFLKHPANQALRQKIREGSLDKQDYYRQLLRQVYRLLFLFVAEDRDLLLAPETPAATRDLYSEYYSTQRLRLLAEKLRGSHRHHDLFQQLRLVLGKLGQEDGCHVLGLPALGGFLFSDTACPDLDGAELSNADLLEAIRCLAVTREGGRRTRVDYKNLASEEMGSVYESLLELHPDLNSDGTKFELRSASGSERKTTGSYYTPDSLIQCLLDTALDPVVDEAVRTARQKFQSKDGEPPEAQAILNLRVIDPAVGSGHFLIAAAHRMAKRLAQVRTGDDEPAPEATRHALRDVIGRCLYGIDVNPMSAELCKVALWMEALEPGKPLSFLDSHVRVGNSLLGTTPALIARGIPDCAYNCIEGDDKRICTSLKRINKQELEGQYSLFERDESLAISALAEELARVETLPDQTVEQIRIKEHSFATSTVLPAYSQLKTVADAWCAAFALPKTDAHTAITTGLLRRIECGEPISEATVITVFEAAREHGFFHWHLAFPHVLSNGGFDVVIGNPPWEKFTISDEEWFSTYDSIVASTKGKSDRDQKVKELAAEKPDVYARYKKAKRNEAFLGTILTRDAGTYPFTGFRELNTYHLFAELAARVVRDHGRVGLVVKTGIGSAENCLPLFKELTSGRRLVSLFDFVNRKPLFQGVQSVERFSLITFTGSSGHSREIQFATLCTDPVQLNEPGRRYTLSPQDIALMSPLNGACPLLRDEKDAIILRRLYNQFTILGAKDASAPSRYWNSEYTTVFHMANDSGLFRKREELEASGYELRCGVFVPPGTPAELDTYQDILQCDEYGDELYLPLLEGKYFYLLQHRYGSFENVPPSKRFGRKAEAPTPSLAQLAEPGYEICPRYWFPRSVWRQRAAYRKLRTDFAFHFRDVAGVYPDFRTAIGSVMPAMPAGHKAPCLSLLYFDTPQAACALLALAAVFTSIPFDYCVRNKLFSKSLGLSTLNQIPIPSPARVIPNSTRDVIQTRLLQAAAELSYTSWSLKPLGDALGIQAPFPFSPERRFRVSREIDAIAAHLYELSRDEFEYILGTFETLAAAEVRAHGEFRTRRIALEAYDAIRALLTGSPQESNTLDPPLANGWTPPPLPPLEEYAPKIVTQSAPPSNGRNGSGKQPSTTQTKAPTAVAPEPEELLLTPPTPKPLRDKDGQEMRVRVYGASEEVLLKRGLAVGKRKNGEGTVWSVIPDGETVPREFKSPPCVVKRLKPKVTGGAS